MEQCIFCDLIATTEPPEGGWIYESRHFRALLLEAMAIPGWVVFHSVRHAEGLAGLNAAESAELGVALQRLSAAIIAQTGDPKTYMYSMCEPASHFHLLIGSPVNAADTPRGAPFLVKVVLRQLPLDRLESLRVAQDIGRLLAEPSG